MGKGQGISRTPALISGSGRCEPALASRTEYPISRVRRVRYSTSARRGCSGLGLPAT